MLLFQHFSQIILEILIISTFEYADGESKGRMVEAIAGFTTVKQWNPSWPEDPKAYAEKMAEQNQQSNK